MTRIPNRRALVLMVLAMLTPVVSVRAQTGGLTQAVLALPHTVFPENRLNVVDGRLYGGSVKATVRDTDGNLDNFTGTDRLTLSLVSRDGTSPALNFSGSRPEFDQWVRANSGAILAILFPENLSSAVSGRSASQLYSQQLLLTTALETEAARESVPGSRWHPGGEVKYESFSPAAQRGSGTGWAWQGLYGFTRTLSLQGRFAQQHEDITTNATTVAIDYHPYLEINRSVRWRVGAAARSGVLVSQSDAMTFGSVDYGGGGWASLFKRFDHVRVGGGTLVQASRSWVPPIVAGDDLSFLADEINRRPLVFDLTYGGSIGVDTSARTALIGKYLESRPIRQDNHQEPLRLWLAGVSYSVGPFASVSGGVKVSSSSMVNAKSLFFQGNLGW